MAKAFPTDNPFLANPYFAPVNTEADAGHLQITGEMPKELVGTLYRNGPNPQFAPRGPHHWFGGDGMIHAFHIENGNVSYKNRSRTRKARRCSAPSATRCSPIPG
jgi:carotenoid cleavage dioxygenase